MNKTAAFAFMALPLIAAITSCSAKIYINDRHTIMEEEAAGEWPQFEKDMLDKSKEQGPTAFQKVELNAKKKRLYNVLNGEMAETEKVASSKTGK